jgi:SAM-dependent methyltransferase
MMESVVPTMAGEDSSGLWEALRDSENMALHAAMYSWPAERIPPGWVIDLGCEYGIGSLLIAEANPALRVTGVDVDLPVLRYSRETLLAEGMLRVNGDGFRLPMASESVSGIYLINLLHLVPEPEGVLFETWRTLMFGGVAIIGLPREELRQADPRGFAATELASHIESLFSEVFIPSEICGHIPALPTRSFALDQKTSPWIACCTKR